MTQQLLQRSVQEIITLRRRIAQLEPQALAYDRLGKMLDLVNLQRGQPQAPDVLQELIVEIEAQERAAQQAQAPTHREQPEKGPGDEQPTA